MHSHLLKIMLILGMLMAVCAGTSLSHFTLHASAMALHSTPGLSMDGSQPFMTTSQPLGSLVSISWNDLQIASSPSGLSQFLMFPSTAEPTTQVVVSAEYATFISDSPEDRYILPSESDRLEAFHLSGDAHPAIGYACAACHVSPEAPDLTTAAFGSGQSLRQAGQAGLNIDCQECHTVGLRQTSAQIRGVE